MKTHWWQTVAVSIFVSNPSVVAQNLALNGEFDTDIGGWTALGPDLTAEWSPLDHASDPSSGSLLATNSSPLVASYAVVSCVGSLPDVERYRFSGWINVPPGQSAAGQVELFWYWYDGQTCVGSQLLAGATPIVTSTAGWQLVSSDWEAAPAGAMSAWLVLGNTKNVAGPGTFQAYYDGLVFIGDGIFADGFESGTTGLWSTTVGLPEAVVTWYDDPSCTVPGPTGGPYGPNECVQMPGSSTFVSFDCVGGSFAWYWDPLCTSLRAVGCPPGMCCMVPFSATYGSVVWSCS